MNFFYRLWDLLTLPFRLLVGLPGRVPQRLLGLSVPARVALLLFVFLLVLAIAVPVTSYFLTANAAWRGLWLKNVGWIALLVVVIPLVAYQALKLWLEGEASRYPDIDYAWKAGLAELQRSGLDITQVPIFLVLGAADEVQEKALFAGSGLSLRIQEVPKGPAPLHWYANPDGVYLTCSGASALSKIAAAGKAAKELAGASPIPRPAASLSRTEVIDQQALGSSATAVQDRGRMPSYGAERGGNIRDTMQVSRPAEGMELAPQPIDHTPLALSPADALEQSQRLEYVCRLLRRIRQPLCPINGILTLLPYRLIRRSPRDALKTGELAGRDLGTIRRTLQLRCPVTAMVSEMEAESGFCELVRRVGPEPAALQRFGKGFNLWSPPLRPQLEALCDHACGAFEDWVYSLFRQKDSLGKKGNTKLYSLLCQIRRDVHDRLANVLVGAYSQENEADGRNEAVLFGGCYFAGTGERDGVQAFVKGVFDKLPAQQEDLSWTQEALADDDRYRRWAQAGLAVNVLLLLGLAGMLVFRFWRF